MASRKHRHEDFPVAHRLQRAVSQDFSDDLALRADTERAGRNEKLHLKALKRDKIQAPFRRSGLAVIAVGER
ncbi:MAG TPA: hypothetical protein DCZ05_05835 [Deltaproteobacteria bacterium]|nr:hypothetical protein [Deltaproteobacteria bacterium]